MPYLLERLAIVQLFDGLFHVLQAQDQHSNVVQGSACGGLSQHDFHTFCCCDMLVIVGSSLGPTHFLALVERKALNGLLVGLFVNSLPDGFYTLFVI